MKEVGHDNIPVSGSKAATKRKERLEFQVPPHDLDATLCHNLSETEAAQMVLYVQKIKENSVGQGLVVRVGDSHHASVDYIHQSTEMDPPHVSSATDNYHPEPSLTAYHYRDVRGAHELRDMGVNTDDEFVINKPASGRDGRASAFGNDKPKWADSSIQTEGGTDDIFNSSLRDLPLQPSFQKKQGLLMQQETPARKMNFDRKASAASLLPIASAIQRDRILSKIFGAESIQQAIYHPSLLQPHTAIVVCDIPMVSNFDENPYLNSNDKMILSDVGVDEDALQSAVINGPIYDKLFQHLDNCKADYSECALLQPMKALRFEYVNRNDDNFKNNVQTLVDVLERANPISGVPSSASQDSGFESQLPTPNNGSQSINMAEPHYIAFNFASLLDVLNDLSPTLPTQPGPISSAHLVDDCVNFNGEETRPLQAVTTCKSCDGDIYAGMVAVKAARAGKTNAWHPKCFKCHTCGDLLADLVYFFHGGNIYCGRDLAHILKIPRCKACDELIFTKEYTAAEGATFHIKHFCCYQCDTPLAGQQYIPDDQTNMPMCMNCYETFHAAKCKNCQHPIAATEEGVNWNNIHWHKNCFICANAGCGKSLIGGRFCIRQDLPFCSPQCVASFQF